MEKRGVLSGIEIKVNFGNSEAKRVFIFGSKTLQTLQRSPLKYTAVAAWL